VKRAPLETRRHFARRVEARQQFLADIIITAVEGGTGYWATAFEYRHETATLTRVVLVPNETYEEAFEIAFAGGPEVDKTWLKQHGYEVETWQVEAAIERIIDRRADVGLNLRARLQFASSNNDAGDIDAGDADSIVQIVCFGEVVYG
jgi:hypothetical protein